MFSADKVSGSGQHQQLGNVVAYQVLFTVGSRCDQIHVNNQLRNNLEGREFFYQVARAYAPALGQIIE